MSLTSSLSYENKWYPILSAFVHFLGMVAKYFLFGLIAISPFPTSIMESKSLMRF